MKEIAAPVEVNEAAWEPETPEEFGARIDAYAEWIERGSRPAAKRPKARSRVSIGLNL